jgi:tetratricopeptide (TPR) repeat protein
VARRAKLLSEAGTFAWHRGEYEKATAFHGEALEHYRQVGDDSGVAFALICLGTQRLENSDYERAAPYYEEALALSRRIRDKANIAMAIRNLAEVERQKGNYERAKTLGMECLSLYQEMTDEFNVATTVGWLGLLAIWSGGEHDLAEGFLTEGLALTRKIGHWAHGAYCLEGFAGLAGARGQGARAARLWGAAEALRTGIGAPLPPDARLLYEPSMDAARAQLGEATWEEAFADGMAMSAEEAAMYALAEGDRA